MVTNQKHVYSIFCNCSMLILQCHIYIAVNMAMHTNHILYDLM